MRAWLLLLVLTVAVGGLVMASAATIGDVASDDLGAEVAVVASCDSDGVTTSFTTAYFPDVPGHYEVTDVVVGGIAPGCDGQDIFVAVTGAGGAELGSGGSVVSGPSTSVPVTPVAVSVDAQLVTGV